LIFGIEEFPVDKSKTGGGTHTGCPGLHIAIGRNPQGPSSPRNPAVAAPPLLLPETHIGCHKERAVPGNRRPVAVLMIAARQWPRVYGFIYVSTTIQDSVNQTGQLTALYAVQRAILPCQTKHLVQARGEFAEKRRSARGVFNDIHVATAGRNRQVSVRKHSQTTHFQKYAFGNPYFSNLEKIIFHGA